jgi:hypothetical protein
MRRIGTVKLPALHARCVLCMLHDQLHILSVDR